MRGKQKVQEGDGMVRFTTHITLKNGKRIYAWQHGLRAFRIVIRKAARKAA